MTDAVDLSIRQFREAWRLLCAESPDASLAVVDGVDYIFSGLPIGFFNVAVLTGQDISTEKLKAHGDNACAWAAGQAVPWLFVLTHEALDAGVDPTSVLDGCGLGPMMPMTAMVAQQVAPVERVPEGLQLTVPQDDAGCSSLLDINSLAYGMELDAGKPLVGTRSFWDDQVAVLGVVGAAPVSCAAVLMVDGYRYVALVATDPAHQRRGYAEAAMRHALDVAGQQHGERPTFLHASEAGRPIYQRMGYLPIATHTIFMEKRFLTGH